MKGEKESRGPTWNQYYPGQKEKGVVDDSERKENLGNPPGYWYADFKWEGERYETIRKKERTHRLKFVRRQTVFLSYSGKGLWVAENNEGRCLKKKGKTLRAGLPSGKRVVESGGVML